MPKFQICLKGIPPPSDYTREAEDLEEAEDQVRDQLHDWADQVELSTECEEASDGPKLERARPART